MLRGIVFDIQRYSIHDGPGIRTTVFLKGCPLHCPWCHNPESQAAEPELMLLSGRCISCGACATACESGAAYAVGDAVLTDRERCTCCGACVEICPTQAREMVGQDMSVGEVMAQIERDTVFYDQSGGGVTFSGGEPLAQPEFLLELLEACRQREIHTALDTCGQAPWEVLDTVRHYVDLFLYDVKATDDETHRRLTGQSNAEIMQNLRNLSRAGHRIVLRVPIVPTVSDDVRHVRQIGALAASLPHLEGIDLLPYHHTGSDKYERVNRLYSLPDLRPPGEDRMSQLQGILSSFGLNVRVGG